MTEQRRNEGSPQDGPEEEDRPGSPGPERQADGQTQQDAGLDGGAAQAAQGEDERVGTNEDDTDDAG
ncbi:MAG: hypothetical protein KY437_01465 [Actinobacteria bacterium]|nr:hypothetical protein [Actinomycetota bacterium]